MHSIHSIKENAKTVMEIRKRAQEDTGMVQGKKKIAHDLSNQKEKIAHKTMYKSLTTFLPSFQ